MRNAVCGLVLFVLTLAAIPVLLISAVFRRPDAFLRFGMGMMRVGRALLGIDVEVRGRDRLDPRRPCVFMGNHLSFLDGPLLMTVIDRPARAVVKRFVFRVPVLGPGMSFAGYVPVDREGEGRGRERIARAARLIRDKGYSFLVFPEGRRSSDGALQLFRRGGFFLALEAGVPIVPVSIRGTYELMPRGALTVRKGPVRITFHEPVETAGYTPETLPALMERVRGAIAAGLTSS